MSMGSGWSIFRLRRCHSWRASFVICETFLRIEPNKDLFRQLFEVKSRMGHDFNGGVLTPMGGMNI